MVKVPSTLYRLASDNARKWYTEQLYNCEKPDYNGLVYGYNNECVSMPYDKVIDLFFISGYGDRKTEYWINSWADRKLIKWSFVANQRYCCFPGICLTQNDREQVVAIIDEKRQREQKILDDIKGGVPA